MSRHAAVSVVAAVALSVGLLPAVAQDSLAPFDNALSDPIKDPYYPAHGTAGVDALHYNLDLRWWPRNKELRGIATIDFRAARDISRVSLDLINALDVAFAEVDGVEVTATRSRNKVILHTGALAENSRHRLVLSYAGTPHPVQAPTTRTDVEGLGWHTTKSGSVWALQEPFGAFSWYPVNDHPSDKAYYDARISAPAKWVGIFNGELLRRRVHNDRTITRWHLASPAASYLTTIAIGKYEVHRYRGPHGLPLTAWLPPGRPTLVERASHLPQIIGRLEKMLGRYPFDRAGLVIIPAESAMETQTMVTMGPKLWWALPHELVHQWYGDSVTPQSWPDLWLNESFAMYIEARYDGLYSDFVGYGDWLRFWKKYDQQFRRSDGPPGDYKPRKFAENCVYTCGALMLHELRKKIGAREFDHVIKSWVQQHKNSNQNRRDYIRFIEKETGRELSHWIHTWLTSKKSLL